MKISMAYSYTRKEIMISFRACITILSFSFRATVLCVRPFNDTLTIRFIFKELLTNVVQLRDHPASAGSVTVFVGNSEFKEHISNNQIFESVIRSTCFSNANKTLNINLLV